MNVRTKTGVPPAAEPVADPGDLAAVVKVLARMTCQLAVTATRSPHPATFRQICVQELRIASHADVDLIEQFLSA